MTTTHQPLLQGHTVSSTSPLCGVKADRRVPRHFRYAPKKFDFEVINVCVLSDHSGRGIGSRGEFRPPLALFVNQRTIFGVLA